MTKRSGWEVKVQTYGPFKASIKGAACQLTHLLSKVSQAAGQ